MSLTNAKVLFLHQRFALAHKVGLLYRLNCVFLLATWSEIWGISKQMYPSTQMQWAALIYCNISVCLNCVFHGKQPKFN